MRHDSNRSFVVAFAAAALALSPVTGLAEEGGKKKGAEHGKDEAAHGHAHGKAEGKPGPGEKAALAPDKNAPPVLPQAPAVSKAATDLAASCPRTTELRAQIEALAEKRKTSAAAIKAAQNESKKQLQAAMQ